MKVLVIIMHNFFFHGLPYFFTWARHLNFKPLHAVRHCKDRKERGRETVSIVLCVSMYLWYQWGSIISDVVFSQMSVSLIIHKSILRQQAWTCSVRYGKGGEGLVHLLIYQHLHEVTTYACDLWYKKYIIPVIWWEDCTWEMALQLHWPNSQLLLSGHS